MTSSSFEGATDGPVKMTSPATRSEEDSNRETRLDEHAGKSGGVQLNRTRAEERRFHLMGNMFVAFKQHAVLGSCS